MPATSGPKYAWRSRTDAIVVHCADTPPSMDVGAAEIRRWHTLAPPKGNGWADIGYHAVIRRDGRVEPGRPLAAVGAHVAGHNATTVAVCLVGGRGAGGAPEANFTPAQWVSLAAVVAVLRMLYPGAAVCGHRDFPGVAKACPSFDVAAWLNSGARP